MPKNTTTNKPAEGTQSAIKNLMSIGLGDTVRYGSKLGIAVEVNPWFVTFAGIDHAGNPSGDKSEGFLRDFSDLKFDGYKWNGPRPTHEAIRL